MLMIIRKTYKQSFTYQYRELGKAVRKLRREIFSAFEPFVKPFLDFLVK